MNRTILAAMICLMALSASAQNAIDTRRKIEVNGSAESEVTPDIIYFSISLKEYFKDSSMKKKVEIEELERQLQTAVLAAGIPKEDFTINNVSSYNYTWEKKKDPGFLARKQYTIKVSDLTKFNTLISAVDTKGIESTGIERYDYSKIESLKRDLKIRAIQAAKDKATYLSAAIGERIARALEIQDVSNDYIAPQPIYRSNMMMKAEAMADAAMPDIDFKKIKLAAQVRVVFELAGN